MPRNMWEEDKGSDEKEEQFELYIIYNKIYWIERTAVKPKTDITFLTTDLNFGF